MSRSMVLKWFFGSLIGLAGGLVLMVVVGALALGNDVFIMDGPDVVGVRSGALAVTLIALCALAALVMISAAVGQFIAWIGAVLNTANLPSKGWLVAMLVVGLLGFPFIANVAYVIAGPDGSQVRAPNRDNSALPGADEGQRADGSSMQAGQRVGARTGQPR